MANTVEDFETAASKGDQDQICRELLAKPLIAQYAEHGGTCEKAVDAALKDTDSFGLTVESVRIADAKATARVKADRGKHDILQTMSLVKEGPGWRISAFGPVGRAAVRAALRPRGANSITEGSSPAAPGRAAGLAWSIGVARTVSTSAWRGRRIFRGRSPLRRTTARGRAAAASPR